MSDMESKLAEVLADHEARWTTHGDVRLYGVIHCVSSRCDWRLRQKSRMTDDHCYEQHRAHVAAMQAAALGPAIAAERAEAVEAVAREWQFGGWTILTAPTPPASIRALALGQRVTDWLRDRADRIEQAGGGQ